MKPYLFPPHIHLKMTTAKGRDISSHLSLCFMFSIFPSTLLWCSPFLKRLWSNSIYTQKAFFRHLNYWIARYYRFMWLCLKERAKKIKTDDKQAFMVCVYAFKKFRSLSAVIFAIWVCCWRHQFVDDVIHDRDLITSYSGAWLFKSEPSTCFSMPVAFGNVLRTHTGQEALFIYCNALTCALISDTHTHTLGHILNNKVKSVKNKTKSIQFNLFC